MVAKILVQEQDGTPLQITFADHAGDFGPTAVNDLRRTASDLDVQLITASLADGAARQSAKFDFGEHRALEYAIRCAFEFAATPVAGEIVELYMGYSNSATAATANPANLSGSDAAYSGYSSNLADSIKQLDRIGVFVCTAQATGTVQVGFAGTFSPKERYGILVAKNEGGGAYHSDDVETHVVLDPIVPESQ